MAEWNEQWDRVNRMLQRVQKISVAQTHGARDDANDTDDLYSFFQNVYHFKDWLKNDPASGLTSRDVEDVINHCRELRISADLCNGSKHLTFRSDRPPRTGDPTTGIGTVSLDVPMGQSLPFSSGEDEPLTVRFDTLMVRHQFSVESAGATLDVLAVATEAVAAWRRFLTDKGLLPPT
jgi:hypothetical protein